MWNVSNTIWCFYNSNGVMSATAGYLSLAMLLLFISVFSISHVPVCFSCLSEIMYPSTLALAVCINLIFTVIISYVTGPAIGLLGNAFSSHTE